MSAERGEGDVGHRAYARAREVWEAAVRSAEERLDAVRYDLARASALVQLDVLMAAFIDVEDAGQVEVGHHLTSEDEYIADLDAGHGRYWIGMGDTPTNAIVNALLAWRDRHEGQAAADRAAERDRPD